MKDICCGIYGKKITGNWIVVYYNNRTEKLLKLEPEKIQKSNENLRAKYTKDNSALITSDDFFAPFKNYLYLTAMFGFQQ
jgi:hypothetical protein